MAALEETSLLQSANNLVREEVTDALETLTVDQQRLQTLWQTALTYAVRSSPIQQFGIGFGVGWISGYLFRQVSRTAAYVVGFGFLAIQGASALGIITVNTRRIKQLAARNIQVVETQVRAVTGQYDNDNLSVYQRLMELGSRHMYLSSGFISGAVISVTF